MVKDAEEEGNKKPNAVSNTRWKWKKIHAEMYKEAIKNINSKEEVYDYFVCPVCGFTAPKYAPDKCPICGAPGTKFIKVV
jgi:rubrerythrin